MLSYAETIKKKQSDIRLLSDWAAMVGLVVVRDHLNTVHYELELELERMENDGKARNRSLSDEA